MALIRSMRGDIFVSRLALRPAVACVAALACAAALADSQAPPASAPAADSQPAPLPFVDGSFTLVALPDTQNYAERYPELLDEQTRWIAANRAAHDIRFVVQLGDLTNRNTPEQWENVRRAMRRLDADVPYALAPGNHDYGPGGDTTSRDSGLNRCFDVASFTQRPTFGGLYEPDRLDSSFHLFTVGGKQWLVIALEWGPRDAVVQWADEVLRRFPSRRAILVTHAYLYSDDTRYDHTQRPDQKWNPHRYPTAQLPGGTNDGEELWQKLVSRHDNIDLVLCGHVLNDGAGRLASTNPRGHIVHQIMADYQERPRGGEGYLRLLEFLPDGRTVQVKTYSPVLDRYLTDPEQQLVLTLSAESPGKP